MYNMFKVNNKNARTTSMTSFWCFHCLLWTYITLFSIFLLLILKKKILGWKDEILTIRTITYSKSTHILIINNKFCRFKKGILRNFTKFAGRHLCLSLFFNIEKETLAQVFSCEFFWISKNIFFYRTPPMAASVSLYLGYV